MAFAFVPPRCLGPSADAQAMAVRAWEFSCVRYNPVYWVVWLGTALLIFVGRLLHACAGQHGPISDPESSIEHEVRVWWIYPTDAAFMGGLGLAVVDLVCYAINGTLTERYHWSKVVVCAVVYSSYVASNFSFLHALYSHSGLHVRAGIAGNAALAIALICMLIVTLVRAAEGHVAASVHHDMSGHSWLYVIYTWVLRTVFVLFLVLMSATYCRLWRAYGPTSVQRLHGTHEAAAVELGVGNSALGKSAAQGNANGDAAATPRARLVSTATHRRAMRYHYCSLLAAFATGAIVAGLVVAAACLDQEALWEALA